MYISRYGFLTFQTPASILWSMMSCMLLVHLGSDKLTYYLHGLLMVVVVTEMVVVIGGGSGDHDGIVVMVV